MARGAQRARDGRRLRARRRLAAVGRARRHRGRARVARLAGSSAARSLVLPPLRRGGPARLESVQPAGAGLSALVQRRGSDLRSRSSYQQQARRLSASAEALRGDLPLGRMRPRDRAGAVVALRRDPRVLGPGKRAGGAGRRTAAGDGPGRGGGPPIPAHGVGGARLAGCVARRLPRILREACREPALRPGELAFRGRHPGRRPARLCAVPVHAWPGAPAARPPSRAWLWPSRLPGASLPTTTDRRPRPKASG